ncbi:MAG: lipid A export permease/ATP-binding protein MsbA [Gammaproteobacteria bacterium]|nr:lipid A export permease/ATP-binding protein MsbA [Gammaproteobacteria bacterium]
MSGAAAEQDSAGVYKRLLGYSLPYWKIFAVSVFAMVFFAATDTAFAALMKPMLDGSFVDKNPDTIRFIPLAIIGLFLIRGVTGFISEYGMAWVGRQVINNLRHAMFQQMLRLPTTFYDKTSSGQLISKLTYDVEQVAHASTTALTVMVRDTLTLIGLMAWMLYLNWMLALTFLVAGPFIALLIAYVNKRFRRISGRIQASMGGVTEAVEQAIEGQRVIKIFGGQRHQTGIFDKVNEANRRQQMKMTATREASVPLIQLVAGSALAGIIALATSPEMLKEITVGTFMSFIVAMTMMLAPIKRLTNIHSSIQRGIVAAESIFELLDREAEKDTGALRIERARGAIEYHNVSFAYDASKGRVLENINLGIVPGQTVAFVGRSGSGKSTLVSLLPRFYDLSIGRITLDGHDIRDLALESLRNQIALVGQEVILFNDTIANNIAYGRGGEVREEEIIRAAEAAHAMEFIRQLPQGLHTVIGEKGVLLSGGQRQRLAIARALFKDAPILILDEATAALDTESERAIQAALEQLVRNRTTLIIAHRLSTIERADVIVVMDRGRIVEQGRHAELLARGGHYASLHRMQFASPQPVSKLTETG